MKRDVNLDILRVISCVAVVGLHSFQENLASLNLVVYRLCSFAIPMFFLVSGYLLIHRDVTIRYSLNKILKISVVVLLWNFLIWFVISIKNLIFNGVPIDVMSLLVSVWQGFVQQGRFWHFWYLFALMIVYLLLPVLSKYLNQCSGKRALLIWGTCAVIGITLQGLSEFVYHYSLQSHIIQSLRIWTWVQYFIFGGLFYRFRDKWHMKYKKWVCVAVVLLSIGIVIYQACAYNWINSFYGELFYDSAVTIIWTGSIFVFVMNLSVNDWFGRLIGIMAPCTMGIYIIHPLLIRYIKRVFYPYTFLSSLVYFLVLLFGSFVITYIIKKIPIVKRLVNL